MFEECSNQWSLSRPMLSLILINEPVYNSIKVHTGAAGRACLASHINPRPGHHGRPGCSAWSGHRIQGCH
jgi:hypothetical protein